MSKNYPNMNGVWVKKPNGDVRHFFNKDGIVATLLGMLRYANELKGTK